MARLKLAALLDDTDAGSAACVAVDRFSRTFDARVLSLDARALGWLDGAENSLRTWLHEHEIDLLVCGKSSNDNTVAGGFPVDRLAALDVPMFAVCPVCPAPRNAGVDSVLPADDERFRHVLVPSDLSESSLAALNNLRNVFDAFPPDALLYLVTPGIEVATDIGRRALQSKPSPAGTLFVELQDMSEWCLEESVKHHIGDEPTLSAVVDAGDPAEAIIRKAEEIDADLIILASQGAGEAGSSEMGSVAAEVMRRSRSCVLCMNPN